MHEPIFSKKPFYPRIVFWISILLTLISFAYLFRGSYCLITDKICAKDLYSRWQEQQYVYRGLYPYGVTQRYPFMDAQIGTISSGGYPPWAFFTGFVFFPPISFELTRWYHGFLNILSLVILGIFAYQIGRPYGKLEAWFTIVACLSISSHSMTLGLGQYGIIINALLICVFWTLHTNHNFLAGFLIGLSLVKPNIAGVYFFILFAKKRTWAIISCCLYIFISSSIIGILVKVSPIYMVDKMISVSQYYSSKGFSGISFFVKFGITQIAATILFAMVAIFIMTAILYLFKENSLLFLFAISSVVGRLFTYHLVYDNVMLVFMLLAVITLTFSKPSKSNILMLVFFLLSLSLPPKIISLPVVQFIQSAIWGGSLIHIIIAQKEFKAAT